MRLMHAINSVGNNGGECDELFPEGNFPFIRMVCIYKVFDTRTFELPYRNLIVTIKLFIQFLHHLNSTYFTQGHDSSKPSIAGGLWSLPHLHPVAPVLSREMASKKRSRKILHKEFPVSHTSDPFSRRPTLHYAIEMLKQKAFYPISKFHRCSEFLRPLED
jgi:hypothetical protein